MANKPSIPKGTRDFLPQEAAKRDYIFSTIKKVFQKYGYLPIETPAVENTETLMGKYGEEGDRLIFKILNSANFIKNITKIPEANARWKRLFEGVENGDINVENYFNEELSKDLPKISNKALRYDLTVPFARFVVQHQNDITFPFKRYQIQPVWRADRPQRGRYREFFQCDVDVIGSDSLLNEVELVQITDEVFTNLNVDDITIKINNRKILTGLAEVVGEKEKIVDITVAIDKLDKIGLEKVNQEMLDKGISQSAVDKLQPLLQVTGSDDEKIKQLREMLAASETGMKGLDELEFLLNTSKQQGVTNVEFDITLARGLNYYTGAIFEVVTKDFPSSITGGGRYDDLTGIFGLPDVSGVGISFGADRIYDVMTDRNLFPENASATTQVMLVNFGDEEANYCLGVLSKLRKAGISSELYPDNTKMGKQMKYADAKGIPYVILVGKDEIESGKLTLKNMESGEQEKMSIDQIISKIA